MRGWYNSFLPFEEFLHDLRLLAQDFLEDERLMPSVLLNGSSDILSLPDLWAMLGDAFAGRVCFAADELLPLWCNLASPARMGTATGRYAEQLDVLRRLSAERSTLRLMDIGCGVGLGTFEAAAIASENCDSVEAVGITSEGLEAWMAANRRIPHDRGREKQFPPRLHKRTHIVFRRGLAENAYDGFVYDVVLCNGLAGGRFLNQPRQIAAFLDSLRRLIAPNGLVLMSNHFHDGTRSGVEAVMQHAAASGWRIAGDWRNLRMSLSSNEVTIQNPFS